MLDLGMPAMGGARKIAERMGPEVHAADVIAVPPNDQSFDQILPRAIKLLCAAKQGHRNRA